MSGRSRCRYNSPLPKAFCLKAGKSSPSRACRRRCLKWHGLTGNQAMLPNVIGEYRVLPSNETFSGIREAPIAIVEWKVPSFAFADRDIQLGYFAEATDIIHEMSGGKQPRDRILSMSFMRSTARGISMAAP